MGLFGGLLGPFCGGLGSFLGHLGPILESSWPVLGRLGGVLGPSGLRGEAKQEHPGRPQKCARIPGSYLLRRDMYVYYCFFSVFSPRAPPNHPQNFPKTFPKPPKLTHNIPRPIPDRPLTDSRPTPNRPQTNPRPTPDLP